MDAWSLPEHADINGKRHPIRSDWRAALEVLGILGDPELRDDERGALAFMVFYPDCDEFAQEDMEPARDFLLWFLKGGDADAQPPKAKLADWEQDAPIIIGAVNRVLGYEARSAENLHWWTFLAAYMEVGDCLFAHVVSIRNKLARGKKLEKHERQFYREHRQLVDLRVKETQEDKDWFDMWE